VINPADRASFEVEGNRIGVTFAAEGRDDCIGSPRLDFVGGGHSFNKLPLTEISASEHQPFLRARAYNSNILLPLEYLGFFVAPKPIEPLRVSLVIGKRMTRSWMNAFLT
jgi:hypothetical protein